MKPDIKDAHPILQEFWGVLKKTHDERYTDRVLDLTCVWRSQEEQQELYAKGRTKPGTIVTNIDGIKILSKHNYHPSRAIDVVVKEKTTGKALWLPGYYSPLKLILLEKKYDDRIAWGGDFVSINDYPHFEIRNSVLRKLGGSDA